MANPALMQKKNGRYLWFALLGMGFQPDTAILSLVGKTNPKYINLGPNMFDKPNKDAFYIVTHFLLEKLNPTRFHEAFRHCWPVVTPKVDAEFRKVACAWLREIMDETANAGSKVVASLFLSPGGHKFISLMLHLASHVMLQEMKTFATDDGWVPEGAAMPASSLDMAARRLDRINARFLKAAVEQDHFLREYQRRAQALVKSMRDTRADGAKYDELLKRYNSDSAQEGASPTEKIKKVRSLWSAIEGMLSSIKDDRHSMESVLKGDVDENVLDGTDQVLKVPRCLLERIEQLPHQLSSGNVYEAGQLNLLCVLELVNHALQLLKEERCRVSHAPKAQLIPEHLQEKRKQMARVLQDLNLIRQKISKEEIPEVSSGIRELETEWDRKWMDTLKDTPLVSFLNEDPALGFLSPMVRLSFEPADEASYGISVFSQYPAKLLEEKPAESKSQDVSCRDSYLKSPCRTTAERIEHPVTTESSLRVNASLETPLNAPASPLRTPSVPPQASVRKTAHVYPKVVPTRATKQMDKECDNSADQVSVRKTARVYPKVAPTRTKNRILDMECDNLADQFADAVTAATSPTEGRVKGSDLEGLLSTLQGDPFSTRKQLPRTPESLILDVKSSWRKAVEEDKAEKIRRSAKFNESIAGRVTPLQEIHNVLRSPSATPQSVSCNLTPAVARHSSPPVSQQGVFLKSALLWDTLDNETLDSPSGTGSSAVQFSLDFETLPELPSCDSLLSLDDEAVDVESEEGDDELLIPSLKTEAKQSPLTTRRHLGLIQQACDVGSFMENVKRTPECLLSEHNAPGLDRDWLMEPTKSVEATNKVFSLDLDTLETPSPPKKQEYSLPKLITFSPIDDMKL